MTNPMELFAQKLTAVAIQENDSINPAILQTNPMDTAFRKYAANESLNRDLKKKIRQNICDTEFLNNIMEQLPVNALIELEEFLWDEAIQYGESIFQQKLTREFIVNRMEPTPNYQRRMMCPEPSTACRANFCIKSNPACAGQKIKDHIHAIASVFNRRDENKRLSDESLEKFCKHFVNKHQIVGLILTNENGAPIVAVSEFDNRTNRHTDHSNFAKSFFKHLNGFIKDDHKAGPIDFDLELKAIAQKMIIKDKNYILTLLSISDQHLDIALFHAYIGLNRILSDHLELQS